jgi:hypothetical protein
MSFLNRFCSLAALALAGAANLQCAHPAGAASQAGRDPAVPSQSAPRVGGGAQESGVPRLASGCLAVCQEATYVEVSPKGDLCRCWAPDAFQYTFAFPDTQEKLAYSRGRWSTGMQIVHRCQAQGFAWEPSSERDQIVCLPPSEQGANRDLPNRPNGTF